MEVVFQSTKLRVLRKWRYSLLIFFLGCNNQRTQRKTSSITLICTDFEKFILEFKERLWRFSNIYIPLDCVLKSFLLILKSFQSWEKGEKKSNLYQLHKNKVSKKIALVMSLYTIFKGSSLEYFIYYFSLFLNISSSGGINQWLWGA